MQKNNKINYAFWGSSRFSVIVLEQMKSLGFIPNMIVTTPDKPQGRKLIVTPNVVKIWANENNVECYTPNTLDDKFIADLKEISSNGNIQTFIVASYGKIIPEKILNIPPRKVLNIHPSLLPQYRGASPLQSAILQDTKNTGVTIMRIDEKMDHGPIIGQKNVTIDTWPIYEDFEEMMAKTGAILLTVILPEWIDGKISEVEQDHDKATYTKKISKEEAEINLNDDPYLNFRKIQAYHEWPVAFFLHDHSGKKMRVKITSAKYEDGNLIIEKVIPEGSSEMTYSDFLLGYTDKK